MNYNMDDVVRIAKRENNKKRKYIFVNPLQGKHLPVSPGKALSMMRTLGQKIACSYSSARLVIGFAETATAIGAVVAAEISDECIYVQTTREDVKEIRNWLLFFEEHSHAPEQKLVADELIYWINNTDTVIFVDDELSTGKTLYNIVKQLREKVPILDKKKLVVASILNSLSDDNLSRLNKFGIACEFLVKIVPEDYTKEIEACKTVEAKDFMAVYAEYAYTRQLIDRYPTPRCGVVIGEYLNFWKKAGRNIISQNNWEKNLNILVLGTEECMIPGLIIGNELESKGYHKVLFHATTRSPISISTSEQYPIKLGWRIRSFYDNERTNYIYNLRKYDLVIIVSDTVYPEHINIQSLLNVLISNGCNKFFYVGVNNINVQYL